jgi:hypothetical protein
LERYGLYKDDPANGHYLDASLDRTTHQIVFTLGFK